MNSKIIEFPVKKIDINKNFEKIERSFPDMPPEFLLCAKRVLDEIMDLPINQQKTFTSKVPIYFSNKKQEEDIRSFIQDIVNQYQEQSREVLKRLMTAEIELCRIAYL